MKQTDPGMRLRFPSDMKAWIEREAEKNLRSQNAEIVFRLRRDMEKENAIAAGAGNEKGDGKTLAG
ncbi:conserved hypothetical protein [uncultured Alphaproteobacteria bacterium]|uniref:Arc-like DNA binding domain-containing protein n=1 Tax=uncultured Alphaproteobacteria bacterium TaxID=91750 RepID=A0A212KM27_9PROT|nr:conserved hypothetical protein [uncultured Alphaproteobacteria bacterium]